MGREQKEIGKRSEKLAETYLKLRGYRILERNYFVKGGELDLIAKKKDTLVFVEVKARKSTAFGTPAEAVTPMKQHHLQKAASLYLLSHPWDGPMRFDVVEIFGESKGLFGRKINIIENAF